VVAAFQAKHLQFPVRIGTGPRKGELAWVPLTHWRVLRTLHNPRYAGAFCDGRRREAQDLEEIRQGPGRRGRRGRRSTSRTGPG
jgi:hypothetical protein